LNWSQRAYIKASNAGGNDYFAVSLSLSADSNTLAVGAYDEDGSSTGINGDQDDDLMETAGAVYLY
jgi:hypothetical protein